MNSPSKFDEKVIVIGTRNRIMSHSATDRYAVLFEDDGCGGYFYALELHDRAKRILDTLHIYNCCFDPLNIGQVILKIVWSEDGVKALLLLDGHAHAVFDFAARRGYCRTAFPPPDRRWTRFSHDWDPAVLDLFR